MAIFRVSHLIADEDYDSETGWLIECIKREGSIRLYEAGPISDFQAKPEVIRRWDCDCWDRQRTPLRFRSLADQRNPDKR